jgi:hypothetical protein
MTETARKWTVNSIQEANQGAGFHWFEPDTMRCFGTRVLPEVYQGDGGVYFVTEDDQYRRELPKVFHVREFNPDNGSCWTTTFDGKPAEFATLQEAIEAARDKAGTNATIQEETHHPITVPEQFLRDLRKHGNPQSLSYGAGAIITNARQHHRFMEAQCNGTWPYSRSHDGEDDPEPVADVRKRIRDLAKRAGAAGVIFSGDPRGCTVKLTFPDGATNDFGQEGWCVPTGEDD